MKTNSSILIVDDEPYGRDILEGLLSQQGYRLTFAENGTQALTQAANLMPDLILLDVMMPDMDGFEVCRRLRADPILREIPIILVTALDDRDSRLEGIEAGADDFVTKPFDRAELRSRVNTITRLNRFRRLLAERSKFEWVIDQADDGYITIDNAGKIHYANRQARLFLGLQPDTSISITESFPTLIRKQYRLEPESAWAVWPEAPQAAEQPARYLVRPETATALAFWLHVDILQLNVLPQTDATWVIRLREVSQSMNMYQSIWEFQAMIAHKLRTPLIGMLTGLELLVSQAEDVSPAEIKMLAGKGLRGVHRLRGEIEDIVNYISMPRVVVSETDQGFNFTAFEAAVCAICANLGLEPATITGLSSLTGDSRLTISQNTLEIILRELLENSKKFHPDNNPEINLLVQPNPPQSIRIRAADNGVHLSPEQLALAWTPYYQGEKYFTGEAKGMGLGLPMVASLVWSVGGKCRLYNRDDGPGVVVELDLPVLSN